MLKWYVIRYISVKSMSLLQKTCVFCTTFGSKIYIYIQIPKCYKLRLYFYMLCNVHSFTLLLLSKEYPNSQKPGNSSSIKRIVRCSHFQFSLCCSSYFWLNFQFKKTLWNPFCILVFLNKMWHFQWMVLTKLSSQIWLKNLI